MKLWLKIVLSLPVLAGFAAAGIFIPYFWFPFAIFLIGFVLWFCRAAYWWKLMAGLLLIYSIWGGFFFDVPNTGHVLRETIRNVFFHVPMWFTMILLLTWSVAGGVLYLSGFKDKYDVISSQVALAAIPFAIIGLITGMFWAKFTWLDWWPADPKLNGVAATLLIYLAYFVLRSSIQDDQKKARIAAIYNIFAYVMMIVFILIIPRFTDSLHPGAGGNPAAGQYDMDNIMRTVFYPAVIGWILIGIWIAQIRIRTERLKRKLIYGE